MSDRKKSHSFSQSCRGNINIAGLEVLRSLNNQSVKHIEILSSFAHDTIAYVLPRSLIPPNCASNFWRNAEMCGLIF